MDNGEQLIGEFNIIAPNGAIPVNALSGGNMQKVVVARELSSSPKLLIAAQPTRGVDIGAIEFIHQELVDQRTQGLAILLISADLQEVMKLSDRIMVMYEGEIVGIFPNDESLTEERIGYYMLGAERQPAAEMEQVSMTVKSKQAPAEPGQGGAFLRKHLLLIIGAAAGIIVTLLRHQHHV